MAKIIERELITERQDENGNIVISSTKNTQKIRAYNEEAFLKLFCQNLGMLKDIRSITTYKVLFGILQYATGRFNNNVFLGFGVKSWLCKQIGIQRPPLYKAIKELVEKNILLKNPNEKDLYVWNPYFVGQGSLVEIANLRQTIQIEYNFTKLTMEMKFQADSVTKAGMEILKNVNDYEVKETSINGDDGEILLEKKKNPNE